MTALEQSRRARWAAAVAQREALRPDSLVSHECKDQLGAARMFRAIAAAARRRARKAKAGRRGREVTVKRQASR